MDYRAANGNQYSHKRAFKAMDVFHSKAVCEERKLGRDNKLSIFYKQKADLLRDAANAPGQGLAFENRLKSLNIQIGMREKKLLNPPVKIKLFGAAGFRYAFALGLVFLAPLNARLQPADKAADDIFSQQGKIEQTIDSKWSAGHKIKNSYIIGTLANLHNKEYPQNQFTGKDMNGRELGRALYLQALKTAKDNGIKNANLVHVGDKLVITAKQLETIHQMAGHDPKEMRQSTLKAIKKVMGFIFPSWNWANNPGIQLGIAPQAGGTSVPAGSTQLGGSKTAGGSTQLGGSKAASGTPQQAGGKQQALNKTQIQKDKPAKETNAEEQNKAAQMSGGTESKSWIGTAFDDILNWTGTAASDAGNFFSSGVNSVSDFAQKQAQKIRLTWDNGNGYVKGAMIVLGLLIALLAETIIMEINKAFRIKARENRKQKTDAMKAEAKRDEIPAISDAAGGAPADAKTAEVKGDAKLEDYFFGNKYSAGNYAKNNPDNSEWVLKSQLDRDKISADEAKEFLEQKGFECSIDTDGYLKIVYPKAADSKQTIDVPKTEDGVKPQGLNGKDGDLELEKFFGGYDLDTLKNNPGDQRSFYKSTLDKNNIQVVEAKKFLEQKGFQCWTYKGNLEFVYPKAATGEQKTDAAPVRNSIPATATDISAAQHPGTERPEFVRKILED